VYRIKVGVNISPQRAILVLLVMTLGFEILRRRRKLRRPNRRLLVAAGSIVAFFLYEVAQLTRTEQPDFSERFLGGFAAGIVIIAVIVLAVDRQRVLVRAMGAFLVSALVPLALGLYQLAGVSLGFAPTLPLAGLLSTDQLFLGNFSTEVGGLAVPRVPSTLAAPAFFGEYLAFVAIAGITWLLLSQEQRFQRIAPTTALVAVTIVGLLATFARSAWLLFAIGVIVVAFQARRYLLQALFGQGRRWLLPTVACLCLATITVLPFPVSDAVTGALESVDLRTSAGQLDVDQPFAGETLTLNPPVDVNSTAASTLTHLNLRREALRLFRQHPVGGVGLGNYGVETQQLSGVSSAQTYGFTVLAEGGVIGFTLFVGMLAALIFVTRAAYRACEPGTPVGAALLGLYVIVLLLVINNLLLYDTLYRDTTWVVLGLAMAAANIAGRAPVTRGPSTPSDDLDCRGSLLRGGRTP
jgi:hypothetical protein